MSTNYGDAAREPSSSAKIAEHSLSEIGKDVRGVQSVPAYGTPVAFRLRTVDYACKFIELEDPIQVALSVAPLDLSEEPGVHKVSTGECGRR